LINEGRIVFDGTVQEMADSPPEMDKRFRELTGAAGADKSRH
jgi:hypothetical protein